MHDHGFCFSSPSWCLILGERGDIFHGYDEKSAVDALLPSPDWNANNQSSLAEQVHFIPPGQGLRITVQGHRYLHIQGEAFAQAPSLSCCSAQAGAQRSEMCGRMSTDTLVSIFSFFLGTS